MHESMSLSLRLRAVVPLCCVFLVVAGRASEEAFEKSLLFSGEVPSRWSAAESAMGRSSQRAKVSDGSLHWHVTVDYETGEVNYPIGWPRVSHAIAEGNRDWSGWEFLRMWVYADSSREALPRDPVGLGLHTPDKASAFHRPLSELRKGEWTEVVVPIAQLPAAGADVRQIQFHISESNYRHGDTLDIYIDDLCLARHAAPLLSDFSAECRVMFSDACELAVRFGVMGVKQNEQVEVACELRREGEPAARGAWKVPRGPQRCVLKLGGERLAPGEYELVARLGGSGEPVTAPVRVVESPWVRSEKEESK